MALDGLIDRARNVHAGIDALSRPALDLLEPCNGEDRRSVCAKSCSGCGRWRRNSKTATSRTPSAALRAAQEALRQALERGASDEEIKKLTEDCAPRSTSSYRRSPRRCQESAAESRGGSIRIPRMLRSQDLKSMLDRLEQLSRSGAKDAARQLLDQLSRCWKTFRWRSRAATWTATTT